jgi:predicted deacetylase
MKKSIGELIDELGVTNMKIFMLVDRVRNNEHTKEDAKKVEELNLHRSKLKNAINEYFHDREEIKV